MKNLAPLLHAIFVGTSACATAHIAVGPDGDLADHAGRETVPGVHSPRSLHLLPFSSCATIGLRLHCWGMRGDGDPREPPPPEHFDIASLAEGEEVNTLTRYFLCSTDAAGRSRCQFWNPPAEEAVESPLPGAALSSSSFRTACAATTSGIECLEWSPGGVLTAWASALGPLSAGDSWSLAYEQLCVLQAHGALTCSPDLRGADPEEVGTLLADRLLGGSGMHGMARRGDTMLIWGGGTGGTLGSPLSWVPPGTIVETAIARDHGCVLIEGGEVYCWGSNNCDIRFPIAPSPPNTCEAEVVTTPSLRSGLPPIAAIATSVRHTCALAVDGSVLCWGSNYHGQLGDGTRVDSDVPVRVIGLPEP